MKLARLNLSLYDYLTILCVRRCNYAVVDNISFPNNNNKFAQSNLGTGPRRGSCARRWLA